MIIHTATSSDTTATTAIDPLTAVATPNTPHNALLVAAPSGGRRVAISGRIIDGRETEFIDTVGIEAREIDGIEAREIPRD